MIYSELTKYLLMKDIDNKELSSIESAYKYIVETYNEYKNDEIIKSFNPKYANKIYCNEISPSRELLIRIYVILNKRLFCNELPIDNVSFEVEFVNEDWLGKTQIEIHDNIININSVKLNLKYKLLLHDWIETVLHECIHIYETIKHPQPFLSNERFIYNVHGQWFQSISNKFLKIGLNVNRSLFDCTINHDEENRYFDEFKKNYVFVRIIYKNLSVSKIYLIKRIDCDNIIHKWHDNYNKGMWKNVKKMIFYKVTNMKSMNLDVTDKDLVNSVDNDNDIFFEDEINNIEQLDEFKSINCKDIENIDDIVNNITSIKENKSNGCCLPEDDTVRRLKSFNGVIDVKKTKNGYIVDIV